MAGLSIFSIIIISVSLTNCSYKSDTIRNNNSNNLNDSTKIDFNYLIKNIESEELIKYETLSYFLPDSVISKISINNLLYGKFKIEVNHQKVVRIDSNGELNGDIILLCFSDSGKLIDIMIIPRYCKANCENIGKAKEITVTNKTNSFEFEIVETENPDANAMPLFKDNQVIKQKKFKLSEFGKFEIIN